MVLKMNKIQYCKLQLYVLDLFIFLFFFFKLQLYFLLKKIELHHKKGKIKKKIKISDKIFFLTIRKM